MSCFSVLCPCALESCAPYARVLWCPTLRHAHRTLVPYALSLFAPVPSSVDDVPFHCVLCACYALRPVFLAMFHSCVLCTPAVPSDVCSFGWVPQCECDSTSMYLVASLTATLACRRQGGTPARAPHAGIRWRCWPGGADPDLPLGCGAAAHAGGGAMQVLGGGHAEWLFGGRSWRFLFAAL